MGKGGSRGIYINETQIYSQGEKKRGVETGFLKREKKKVWNKDTVYQRALRGGKVAH